VADPYVAFDGRSVYYTYLGKCQYIPNRKLRAC